MSRVNDPIEQAKIHNPAEADRRRAQRPEVSEAPKAKAEAPAELKHEAAPAQPRPEAPEPERYIITRNVRASVGDYTTTFREGDIIVATDYSPHVMASLKSSLRKYMERI